MESSQLSPDAQQQAAVFDAIGARYEALFGANATQEAAVHWLIEHLTPSARVLDVGSGTGVPTARILAEAGHHVVGIDISREMVQIAQQQVPDAVFYQQDVANLPQFDAPFDAATAFFSLLMLRRSAIDTALQRLAECVRPQGYLVLAMVEGDFDYITVPFIDQTVRVSGYPRDVLAERLQASGWAVLNLQINVFQAEGAPPETQLFFFCQRAA